MTTASKIIGMIQIAVHGSRALTDALLKKMGLKLSDFTHEEKELGRKDAASDSEDAAKEKPLKKLFTSVEVDVLIDELRQKKAERQGLGQLRANRGDTGSPIFGDDGLKNIVAPRLVSSLLAQGFALIEVERERKPARYTRGDVHKARKMQADQLDIPENQKVKPVPTGEDGKVTEEDAKKANEAQSAYYSSIQDGLLKKTHPTVDQPTGMTQVWKYVVRATFLRSEEDGGAVEIAKNFEEQVLTKAVWENCHIWENPDGSATVNLTPQQEESKTFTIVDFEDEGEEFITKVVPNKDHREWVRCVDPNLEPQANQKILGLVSRETSRIKYERERGLERASWRQQARKQAWRPAPGQSLSDQLRSKVNAPNGDKTPPAAG